MDTSLSFLHNFISNYIGHHDSRNQPQIVILLAKWVMQKKKANQLVLLAGKEMRQEMLIGWSEIKSVVCYLLKSFVGPNFYKGTIARLQRFLITFKNRGSNLRTEDNSIKPAAFFLFGKSLCKALKLREFAFPSVVF